VCNFGTNNGRRNLFCATKNKDYLCDWAGAVYDAVSKTADCKTERQQSYTEALVGFVASLI
jgi:hypothetical protein